MARVQTSPTGRVRLFAHGDAWILEIDGKGADRGRGAAIELIPSLVAAKRGRDSTVRRELDDIIKWLRRT